MGVLLVIILIFMGCPLTNHQFWDTPIDGNPHLERTSSPTWQLPGKRSQKTMEHHHVLAGSINYFYACSIAKTVRNDSLA